MRAVNLEKLLPADIPPRRARAVVRRARAGRACGGAPIARIGSAAGSSLMTVWNFVSVTPSDGAFAGFVSALRTLGFGAAALGDPRPAGVAQRRARRSMSSPSGASSSRPASRCRCSSTCPFKQIASANVRAFADGTGEVTVGLTARAAHPLSCAVAERASAALRPARTGAALRRQRPRVADTLGPRAGGGRRASAHAAPRARPRRPASRAASRRRPPEEESAMTEAAQVARHGVPRGVLIAAAALVAFALGATWFARNSGVGDVHMPTEQAYQVLAPRFRRRRRRRRHHPRCRDRRRALPRRAGHQRLPAQRAARLRARTHCATASDAAQPFTLTRWRDGTLSLQDEATGRRIDLDAFGPTQAQAFAHLFAAKEDAK